MNNTASRFTTPALLVAMLACAGSSWADEAYTPTYGEAQVDKSVGTSEYSGATKAQELDTNTWSNSACTRKVTTPTAPTRPPQALLLARSSPDP